MLYNLHWVSFFIFLSKLFLITPFILHHICILYSKALSILLFDVMLPKYFGSDTCSVIYLFNSVFALSELVPHIFNDFVFVSEISILHFLLVLLKEFAALWSSSYDLATCTWSSAYSIYLYLFCDSWIMHLVVVLQSCGTLIIYRSNSMRRGRILELLVCSERFW
jgi:hypothetical protein